MSLRTLYSEDQERDESGKFSGGGGGGNSAESEREKTIGEASGLDLTKGGKITVRPYGGIDEQKATTKEVVKIVDKNIRSSGYTRETKEKTVNPPNKMGKSTAYTGGSTKTVMTYSHPSRPSIELVARIPKYGEHTVSVYVKDASDPYRGAEMSRTTRHLHTLLSKSEIRVATFEDREHLVVPVVALVEGVIHAVNSDHPELVLASEFSKAPLGWNGEPVLTDHPAEQDERISANDPRVLEKFAIGRVFNTRVQDRKLLMEAWIDVERARKIGAERTLERIRSGDPTEISVGAFVMLDESGGSYRGKRYAAIWREIVPDHLAILPEGATGACSVAMGCGVNRAASCYRPLYSEDQERDESGKFSGGGGGDSGGGGGDSGGGGESIVGSSKGLADNEKVVAVKTEGEGDKKFQSIEVNTKWTPGRGTLPSAPLKDKINTLKKKGWEIQKGQITQKKGDRFRFEGTARYHKFNSPYGYTESQAVKEFKNASGGGETMKLKDRILGLFESFRTDEDVSDDDVRKRVDRLLYASVPGYLGIMEMFTAEGKVVYTTMPDGEQKLFRRSIKIDGADVTLDEDEEEVLVTTRYEPVVAQQKEDVDMNKKERVAAIIASGKTCFQSADSAVLEQLPEERIKALEDHVAAPAVETKPVETKKPLTEEEFLAQAPESIQTIVSEHKAASAAKRSRIVERLKTAQKVYTEAELTAMSVSDLERLDKLVPEESKTKTDFSGKGMPRAAESGDAPPPPIDFASRFKKSA